MLERVDTVWKRYNQRFDNEALTFLFKEALVKKPLFHKTERLVIRAVKQIGTAPITLLLIVNVPDWFGESQLGFFDNLMRKNFDLKGVPIRFITRKKG